MYLDIIAPTRICFYRLRKENGIFPYLIQIALVSRWSGDLTKKTPPHDAIRPAGGCVLSNLAQTIFITNPYVPMRPTSSSQLRCSRTPSKRKIKKSWKMGGKFFCNGMANPDKTRCPN